jgi:hypothetical protein
MEPEDDALSARWTVDRGKHVVVERVGERGAEGDAEVAEVEADAGAHVAERAAVSATSPCASANVNGVAHRHGRRVRQARRRAASTTAASCRAEDVRGSPTRPSQQRTRTAPRGRECGGRGERVDRQLASVSPPSGRPGAPAALSVNAEPGRTQGPAGRRRVASCTGTQAPGYEVVDGAADAEADRLAEDFHVDSLAWSDLPASEADLYVNATPVGWHDEDPSAVPENLLEARPR